MRRVLLLVVTATLAGVVSLSRAPELAAQSPAPRIGTVELSTVAEWQTGTRDGLLVSNNQDGELRLVEDRPEGIFDTGLIKTEFLFNAVGAVWQAEAPRGTSLNLEVRGGPSADQLSDWQPLAAGDVSLKSADGDFTVESVRPFPAGSTFLQLRATFNTTVANAFRETRDEEPDTQGPWRAAFFAKALVGLGRRTDLLGELELQGIRDGTRWLLPQLEDPALRAAAEAALAGP